MSQFPPDPPVAGTPPPPPPVPPVPPGGGMSGGVKALIAVVVLVIVAVGAFLVLGGDDDDGGDPAQAVREFLAAAQDRDCERMLGLVSEASWSQNGTVDREGALELCATEARDEDFYDSDVRVDAVEVASQSGNTAEVAMTWTSPGEGEQTDTIPLVREGGRWVLDFALQFGDAED